MQRSADGIRMWLGILLTATGIMESTRAAGTQPVVAIHDSELTRALESMPASGLTPPGSEGNTGFQWWLTNWNYFVMPESMKEALRSDGTAFTVLGDSNISSGALLDGSGKPIYPILISLASEAINDSEIAQLTNYVAAGGYLLVGSSAFTRNPDGSPRGDFAIAAQMGLDSATPNLTNWVLDSTFTKVGDHRLVSHIPAGTLHWKWPVSADEISLGVSPNFGGPLNHYIWQVTPKGATVLANGDSSPYLLVQPYGKGWFIYHAAMQPLLGHGGYDSGMYAYVIFRRAIEWAFQSAGLPVAKLSPWPYSYDAAVMFRHDMEDFPSFINSIEASAQYEHSMGAKGDYYFCTGALRNNYSASDQSNEVASLQRAITQYGATIGSHNGGLSNSYNLTLTTNSYDFYHWGPDEVLDFSPPAGYASGQAYALASLSNSFADIEGWGLTNGSGLRFFAAPSFNGTRERSLDLLQQLHVATTGEEKLSPFPHFIRSTETPGKSYSFVNMPVSDWYVGNEVAQSMESGHTVSTMEAAVDFYYGLGTLINLYSHSAAAGASLAGDLGGGVLLVTEPVVAQAYVNYSLSKPRVWSANAEGIYDWWLARSNAQISASASTSGELSTTVLTISGAQDPNTAVEVLAPDTGFSGLQVLTNGIVAGGNYRVNGQVVKVWVGTNVSTVQVQYTLNPAAVADYYQGVENTTLTVGAPGVLTNDTTGASAGRLSAVLVSGPAHGSLTLNADGSFAYTPVTNFYGSDSFTYQASDGVGNSAATGVTISVIPTGALFFDDFTRATDPGPLTPWTAFDGNWTVSGGQLSGNSAGGYAMAYIGAPWTNYSVEGQVTFSAAGGEGGGLGGRFDPGTGNQYVAWVYPEGSSQGPTAKLQLVKYYSESPFGFALLQEVTLPGGVGTGTHDLRLSFFTNQIQVSFDGAQVISLVDPSPYLSGGISTILYESATPFVMSVQDVLVMPIDNKPVLTVTADNQGRAYGAPNPSLSGTLAGVQNGDNITVTYTTTAATTSPVGTYAILPVLNDPNNKLGNYTVLITNGILTITPAALTVTATGIDRVYDGTSNALVTLSDNKVPGDDVTPNYANGFFADKNAGTNKTVTVTGISISGSASSNYTFNATATTTASITPLGVVGSVTAADKPYDGTATAIITSRTLAGVLSGDDVSYVGGSATFADKNVGMSKKVTAMGLGLLGGDAGNYTANSTATTTASITGRPLVVSAQGANKLYDGTPSAAVTLSDNRVPGDSLSASYGTASFGDKKVGTAKTVNVSGITISGGDAPNYSLQNSTTTTTANITALGLTVTAIGVNKVYDATTNATTVLSDNRLAGDQLTDSYAKAFFADKNVGTNKPVTVTGIAITGPDAGNYSLLNTSAVTTATITPRPLNVWVIPPPKDAAWMQPFRTYDGTTTAYVYFGCDVLPAEHITSYYRAANFSDKNVGTNKLVRVTGIYTTGADAPNYALQQSSLTTTGNISVRSLKVTAKGQNKVYDTTIRATATLSNNKIAGDVVANVYTNASFATKTVGTNKTVTVLGISISGADAANYSLENTSAGATASITGRALVVSAQGVDKLYDGTSSATVTLSDNRVAGDSFADNYGSASFADKNAGMAKPVSVSAITITGPDAGNYSFNTTAATSASITARPLSVTAVADSKTYDGTTGSSGVPALVGGLGSGDLGAFTQSFDTRNAGTNKTLIASGVVSDGNGGNNYAVTFGDNTNGVIGALGITGSVTAASKVYDGTTAATITSRTLSGVLANDEVSYVGGNAEFADPDAGADKTVTATGLSLSGTDAGNYAVNPTAATTADITPAMLTVAADNKSRTYGQPNPPLTATVSGPLSPVIFSALVSPDMSGSPSLITTATPASPVGTYPINVSVGTLSAPNYEFTFVPGVLTILPPPNTPPVLPAQSDHTLLDLTTLTVINTGTDSDVPAQTLSYQLLNPPAGMQIDGVGIITWTPLLAQSPSTNVVVTVVTDDGIPPLSATNTFQVIVTGPYDGIDLTDPVKASNDLDHDGLSNLMEYGLGTDPRNPADAAGALQIGVVSSNGSQYVSLEFQRRIQDGGISIQYLPEVSADGQTWYSDSSHVLEVSATPLNAQFDLVLVRDQSPTSAAAPRYIRLRILEN